MTSRDFTCSQQQSVTAHDAFFSLQLIAVANNQSSTLFTDAPDMAFINFHLVKQTLCSIKSTKTTLLF